MEPELFRIHVLRLTRVALLIFMLLTIGAGTSQSVCASNQSFCHLVPSFVYLPNTINIVNETVSLGDTANSLPIP